MIGVLRRLPHDLDRDEDARIERAGPVECLAKIFAVADLGDGVELAACSDDQGHQDQPGTFFGPWRVGARRCRGLDPLLVADRLFFEPRTRVVDVTIEDLLLRVQGSHRFVDRTCVDPRITQPAERERDLTQHRRATLGGRCIGELRDPRELALEVFSRARIDRDAQHGDVDRVIRREVVPARATGVCIGIVELLPLRGVLDQREDAPEREADQHDHDLLATRIATA